MLFPMERGDWPPFSMEPLFRPFVETIRTSTDKVINYNYLVHGGAGTNAVLIDPSWEKQRILSIIDTLSLRLDAILVTHSHPDHIDLAEAISNARDCPVIISEEEVEASGFRANNMEFCNPHGYRCGRMIIRPILTPGHTVGCVCYEIGGNLFTGDVLFAEGCGLCKDMASAHEMFKSLEQLKCVLRPDTKIYPGHSYGQRPGMPFSRVIRENIYLQFRNKEEFASFRMRKQQCSKNLFNFK